MPARGTEGGGNVVAQRSPVIRRDMVKVCQGKTLDERNKG